MQWIKASERLPEYNKPKHAKMDKAIGVMKNSKLSNGYVTFNGSLELANLVEWLDESDESPESSVWPGEEFENAIYHIIEHFVNNDRQEDCVNRLMVAFKQLQSRTAVKAEELTLNGDFLFNQPAVKVHEDIKKAYKQLYSDYYDIGLKYDALLKSQSQPTAVKAESSHWEIVNTSGEAGQDYINSINDKQSQPTAVKAEDVDKYGFTLDSAGHKYLDDTGALPKQVQDFAHMSFVEDRYENQQPQPTAGGV